MIPKQRNHPNIVNKLIGKSSLKSKQVDEDLTQTCCINQAKMPLFSAPEKHHHGCSVFCSPRKHHPGCSIFCPPRKHSSTPHSLSKKKPAAHRYCCSYVFPLKHKALMGLSGNGLKRIKIGLDPLYNLPLQPNIRGDYTLTSQLESMPADPAQSFSFSLVTTFVIISEGLKSV